MDGFDKRNFVGDRQLVVVGPVTLTPASVAANITAEQTIAMAGLLASDLVISVQTPAAAGAGGVGIVGARVPSAGNIAVTFSNNTAGALIPTSQGYTVVVLR